MGGGLTLLVLWLPPNVFKPINSPLNVAADIAILIADTARDCTEYASRVMLEAPGASGNEPLDSAVRTTPRPLE